MRVTCVMLESVIFVPLAGTGTSWLYLHLAQGSSRLPQLSGMPKSRACGGPASSSHVSFQSESMCFD